MKTTFQITKNELRNLFYSPIAWFLLIIFTVMCGYFYTSTTYLWAKATQMGASAYPDWQYRATLSATTSIFLEGDSLLINVLQSIYLFVPLLTMSIISREISAGTIRLLYSSPIKLSQIVIGKYFAMMIYNLLLVLVVGIFIVNGFFDVLSLDYGPLLSTLLAFYLLLCVLAAIGMYMSSLTAYPIVSAIASFTVFFSLMNIGRLWQEYDFVRDITWFLSILGRTEKMIGGLIVSKDVLYYILIVCMFLGFTILKLRNGREKKPWYVKAGRHLVVAAVCILAGFISSRPRFTGYWDTTARKTNTISEQSQQIIKSLKDGPLEVTLYTNLIGPGAKAGLPESRNRYLSECWEPYQRFKKDIIYKYKYYYDADTAGFSGILMKDFPGKTVPQIAAEVAKVMQVDTADFKTPEEMRKEIDLRPENLRLVMRLKYKDRSVFLRTYGSGDWPKTINTDAALLRLLGEKMPKVVFVTGELERNIYKTGEREYSKDITNTDNPGALVNIGFDVDTIDLSRQDIPRDISTLVLADPKMEPDSAVIQKLRTYINNGGNMLINGEPGKQHILNPLIQKTGFRLLAGKLAQPSQNDAPDLIKSYVTMAGLEMIKEEPALLQLHYWLHNIRDDSLPLPMPSAMGIAATGDSGFASTVIATTYPGVAWSKMGKFVTDSVPPVFSAQDGDIMENTFPTVMQLSRKINNREQRILLCSDADFLSNRLSSGSQTRSYFRWLNYNRMPVYSIYPYAADSMVILSPQRASIQKIVYVWILPGMLALLGAVLLIRRKRK